MTYVIYDKDTTVILAKKSGYKTMAAAQAQATRLLNEGVIKTDVGIAEYEYFCKHIEKMVTVKNLMTGKPVQQRANTPRCCDVSSETYWSM